jgi:uncharacterized protein YdcH (DUF465 family)
MSDRDLNLKVKQQLMDRRDYRSALIQKANELDVKIKRVEKQIEELTAVEIGTNGK